MIGHHEPQEKQSLTERSPLRDSVPKGRSDRHGNGGCNPSCCRAMYTHVGYAALPRHGGKESATFVLDFDPATRL